MRELFTVLLVVLALVGIGATMYFVLKEKPKHDAHLKYVRSPWAAETITPTRHTHHVHDKTVGEALAEPVTVPEPDAEQEPEA